MMKNNTNTLKRALYKNIILMVSTDGFLIWQKKTKNQFALLIINHRTNGENTRREGMNKECWWGRGGRGEEYKKQKYSIHILQNATDPRQ